VNRCIRHRFLIAVFLSALGYVLSLSGCADNPASPSDALQSLAPLDLVAVSIDDSTVGLQWGAPDNYVSVYLVSWRGEQQHDTGSFIASATTVSVGRLHSGQPYIFEVAALRGGSLSPTAEVRWAPAMRFKSESGRDSTIRIYESASSYGSGLAIFSAVGGPRRLSIYTQGAQLALTTDQADPDHFEIGTVYARLGATVDSSVYISTRTYLTASLDDWHHNEDLDADILSDGNRRVFYLPGTISDELGRGFFVRITMQGRDYYGRVLINNVKGRLLQGTPPDRYIEVTVSYQATPDLPFARNERGSEGVFPEDGKRITE
jgi:hypothetical protein